MPLKNITIGDISQPINVGWFDSALDLSVGFTCKMQVQESGGAVVIDRMITLIENNKFKFWLTEAETALFTAHHTYIVVCELENQSLPKPIKREEKDTFTALPGLID